MGDWDVGGGGCNAEILGCVEERGDWDGGAGGWEGRRGDWDGVKGEVDGGGGWKLEKDGGGV